MNTQLNLDVWAERFGVIFSTALVAVAPLAFALAVAQSL